LLRAADWYAYNGCGSTAYCYIPRGKGRLYVYSTYLDAGYKVSVERMEWLKMQQLRVAPFQRSLRTIYLTTKIPNFVDTPSLDTPNRKLSIVCDVSADTINPNNPIPIYTVATTFDRPTVLVEVRGEPVLSVIRVGHPQVCCPERQVRPSAPICCRIYCRGDAKGRGNCCAQQTGVNRMIGCNCLVTIYLGVTNDLSAQCLSR